MPYLDSLAPPRLATPRPPNQAPTASASTWSTNTFLAEVSNTFPQSMHLQFKPEIRREPFSAFQGGFRAPKFLGHGGAFDFRIIHHLRYFHVSLVSPTGVYVERNSNALSVSHSHKA